MCMSKRRVGNTGQFPLFWISALCHSTDGDSVGTQRIGAGVGDEKELWRYVVDETTHDPGLPKDLSTASNVRVLEIINQLCVK